MLVVLERLPRRAISPAFDHLQLDGHRRVCRLTMAAEAYALQASIEESTPIRAATTDMQGNLNLRNWEFSSPANLQIVSLVDRQKIGDLEEINLQQVQRQSHQCRVGRSATVFVAASVRDDYGRSGSRVS